MNDSECPACGNTNEDNFTLADSQSYWDCCFRLCPGPNGNKGHVVKIDDGKECSHLGCEFCSAHCPGHKENENHLLYSTECACMCLACRLSKDGGDGYEHCCILNYGCHVGEIVATLGPGDLPPITDSSFPMWQRRGVTINPNIEKKKKRLPMKTWKNIDPGQMMSDFYLASLIMDSPSPTTEAKQLSTMAAEYRSRIVATMDPLFCLYLDIAVGGELRHHPSIKKRTHELSVSRSKAWREWLIIRDQLGVEGLRDAAAMFRDGTMSSGYGGDKWAIAADILYSRLTDEIPPWMFVDRVFALQHNAGSVLNKVSWKAASPLSLVNGVNSCFAVGVAHDNSLWGVLAFNASKSMQILFMRWWRVVHPDEDVPLWARECFNEEAPRFSIRVDGFYMSLPRPLEVCRKRIFAEGHTCYLVSGHQGPHTDFKESWEDD